MTTVACTSSAAGMAFLRALVSAGALGSDRIVLLLSNEAAVPEVVDPWAAPDLGLDGAEIIRWNDLIAPLHPGGWQPSAPETPVLSRLLASRLAPDDEIGHLVVESVTSGAGRALVDLIPNVPITITNRSLEVYAPVLADPSSEIGGRVARLIHLDLLSGLSPLLRYHDDVTVEPMPVSDFAAAVDLLASAPTSDPHAALLLGDRLAERGLITSDRELELRTKTVRAIVAAGHTEIVFAPHPQAAPADHSPLVEAARAAGARLVIAPAAAEHEQLARRAASLVVGTSSPALFLARHAATSGCHELLALKIRYDSVERMPVTLADAALPRLEADGALTPPSLELGPLRDAVACLMRPGNHPELRRSTLDWAAAHGASPYLRPALITKLKLSEDYPRAARKAQQGTARRVARKARSWLGDR